MKKKVGRSARLPHNTNRVDEHDDPSLRVQVQVQPRRRVRAGADKSAHDPGAGRTSVSLTERRGTTTERKPRRPDSETPASLDDLSARKRNAARACSASSTPPHLKVSEVSRVQRNRAACDGSRFSRPQSPRRPLGVLVLAFGSPLIINDGPNIENVNHPPCSMFTTTGHEETAPHPRACLLLPWPGTHQYHRPILPCSPGRIVLEPGLPRRLVVNRSCGLFTGLAR